MVEFKDNKVIDYGPANVGSEEFTPVVYDASEYVRPISRAIRRVKNGERKIGEYDPSKDLMLKGVPGATPKKRKRKNVLRMRF